MIPYFKTYKRKKKLKKIEHEFVEKVHLFAQKIKGAKEKVGENSIIFQQEMEQLLHKLTKDVKGNFPIHANKEEIYLAEAIKEYTQVAKYYKQATTGQNKYMKKIEKHQKRALNQFDLYKKEMKNK